MARTLVKTIDIDQLNSDISGINEVPDVGLDDQVVKKFGSGATDYQFETILEVPSGGTTGQILTKTATGYEWQTPTGGGVQIHQSLRYSMSNWSYTVPSGMYAHSKTRDEMHSPDNQFYVTTAGTVHSSSFSSFAWQYYIDGQIMHGNYGYVYLVTFKN